MSSVLKSLAFQALYISTRWMFSLYLQNYKKSRENKDKLMVNSAARARRWRCKCQVSKNTWLNHQPIIKRHVLCCQTFVFLSSGAEPPLFLRKWHRIVSNFSVNRSSISINLVSMLSIRCSRNLNSVPWELWTWALVIWEWNEGRVSCIEGMRVCILGSLPPAGERECNSIADAPMWSCGIRPLMINVGEPARSSLSTPWRDENVDRALDNFREPGFASSGNKTISSSYEENEKQLYTGV